MSDFIALSDPNHISNVIRELERRVRILETRTVTGVQTLDEFTDDMGIVQAGEFRCGNGVEPGEGFSGVRIAYPAMSYNSQDWNFAGVDLDVLQAGISATDGKFYAGAGAVILDDDGITISEGTYDSNKIKFTNATGVFGYLYGATGAVMNTISLYCDETGAPTQANISISTNLASISMDGGTIQIHSSGITQFFPAADTTASFSIEDASNSRIIGVDSTNRRMSINVDFPGAALDIASSNGVLSLLIGADVTALTRTNSTRKYTRIGMPHYTNAQEPAALFVGDSDGTDNILSIGGSSSAMNACSIVRFYTAADAVTVTGTERMRIHADGNVSIGSATSYEKLMVNGAIMVNGDATGYGSTVCFTNVVNTSISTGVGSIKTAGTTARTNTGWLKIMVGTAARYIPYFTTITG